MIDNLTGDLGVFVFGIGVTIMFLTGYFYTIKEFNELKDQREENAEKRKTNIVDKSTK